MKREDPVQGTAQMSGDAASVSDATSSTEAVQTAVRVAIAATVQRRRGRPKGSPARPKADVATLPSEARTTGAIILEVLAGMRTTTDASQALGISPVRYYAIEARAVHALIAACAPRSSGPTPDIVGERELIRLRDDKSRLEHETARLRALMRATQRGIGVPPAPDRSAKREIAGGKTRRARRPAVRALTVVRRLLRAASTTQPPSVTSPHVPNGR